MKHAKGKNGKISKTIIGLVVLFGMALIAYIAFGVHYSAKFMPGSTAYGVNIGNLDEQQAKKKLQKSLANRQIKLIEKGKTVAVTSSKKLGLTQDFSDYIDQKLAAQNPWLFSKESGKVDAKTKNATGISETALNQFVQTSLASINAGRKETKNASIVRQDGEFVIKPEVQGDSYTEGTVKQLVTKAVESGQTEVDLDGHYTKPSVTKDDSSLKQELTKLKKLSSVRGTYKIAGDEVTIPKVTIASWLSYDGKNVNFNTTAMTEYLRQLNKQYATYGKTFTFQSTKRGTVSVPGETYGWSIDIANELKKLENDILAGKSFTRTPEIQGSGYERTSNNGIGNTYVEVDKVNQHEWVYVDGKLVISTDIVTGKPKQATPVGVFYVWSKQRNATLRGLNDDGTKYASPVSYWMPIDYTGVGLHDSPWQPKYGGDWYVEHGSHGCVNTPPSVMAKLYNLIPVGTPVIVI